MSPPRSVITIGNFDGVHAGHRALIDEARRAAAQDAARVLVISFDPHPMTILRPESVPPMLTARAQRREALFHAGADEVRFLTPSRELLALSPRQFIEQILHDHAPIAIVEGPDFRFGRNREGDTQILKQLGSELGFEVHIVPPVTATLYDRLQAPLSSSLVRWLISAGRVADARLCLQRPYQLQGMVITGEQRGRTIGIPTANLDVADQLLPADGVYAASLDVDGARYLAALSVGPKPTFRGAARIAEAHLLDYAGDLYGKTIALDLHRRLRDQQRFPSLDALKRQLHDDIHQVRYYARLEMLDPPLPVGRAAI